jgi:hypothetical protein
MDVKLVVVRPFGSRARGDVVTDPTQVVQILSTENANHVVRVSVPAAVKPPSPAVTTAPAPTAPAAPAPPAAAAPAAVAPAAVGANKSKES